MKNLINPVSMKSIIDTTNDITTITIFFYNERYDFCFPHLKENKIKLIKHLIQIKDVLNLYNVLHKLNETLWEYKKDNPNIVDICDKTAVHIHRLSNAIYNILIDYMH